ncbi:hypothetical protein [Pseudomonas protegens]|uniref:hypothetical protein n=1 Tax=Pseudomonas protegens TaxID=380021 RepID=UPI0011AFCECD|nr:hypothetical protein [Pseudomonas protegens]
MSDLLCYQDIQRRMFYYYPVYCRDKLWLKKRFGSSWVDGELEVGYALNEMEGCFKEPVENLMFYTAGLILSAGREPEVANCTLVGNIKNLIGVYGLEKLLGGLSLSDAEEVKSDLELLGIL